jgi:hypothetical protein
LSRTLTSWTWTSQFCNHIQKLIGTKSRQITRQTCILDLSGVA